MCSFNKSARRYGACPLLVPLYSSKPSSIKSSESTYAYITSNEVEVDGYEFVKDAYEEILREEKNGNIKILRYDEVIKLKKEWLYDIINKEYNDPNITEDYKFFLENKFKNIIERSK